MMWNVVRLFLVRSLLPLLLVSAGAVAGQTGKIAGRVTDGTNKEPLIGATVMLQGTAIGTTTDLDGFYTINNISPGTYTVVVSFIGYRKTSISNVMVRIDLTTRVDAVMQPEAVQAEDVV